MATIYYPEATEPTIHILYQHFVVMKVGSFGYPRSGQIGKLDFLKNVQGGRSPRRLFLSVDRFINYSTGWWAVTVGSCPATQLNNCNFPLSWQQNLGRRGNRPLCR